MARSASASVATSPAIAVQGRTARVTAPPRWHLVRRCRSLPGWRPAHDRPARRPLPRDGAQQRLGQRPAARRLRGALRATLNHLHAVDLYYIDALEGAGRGPAAFGDAPDFAEPAALRAAQAASDARLIALCDRLSAADLDRPVPTDRGAAGIVAERRHPRCLPHVMLGGSGVPPPQLDEFFLHFDRHPSVAELGMSPTEE
jgi:uncharacterized damage-inducible protein DinB